jgi:formamidopyrimidine-DNA glycosylase
MPELPEVETTRLGLLPLVAGARISRVVVRERRLRWPIPKGLPGAMQGRTISTILRRGKYLLWNVEADAGGGFLLCHLGMSGSLGRVHGEQAVGKHDHVDIELDSHITIRYHDPRRFGAILWIAAAQPNHALLDSLGPEPLGDAFTGEYLFRQSRGRRQSVKEFIMDAHQVVGVGNIYASESLFHSGIRPTIAAGRISLPRYIRLAAAIRDTLGRAIAAGGSSLRDYVHADGELGYFQTETMVYARAAQPCYVCGSAIRTIRQGQRSSFFCAVCQR